MDSKEVAQVDVQSAWLSKINWGEVVKVLCAFAAVKGINIPVDIQNDILMTIIGAGAVYTFVMKTWFTKTITPASAAGPDVPTKTIAKVLLLAFAVSLFLVPRAEAADLTTKANPFITPYDLTKAGAYFGFGFGGSESTVNGTAAGAVIPGTQIVQGSIYGTVGYGAPIGSAGSFWFAEAQFGIQNLNGNVNGLSLSGPATFTQRFGAGTPLNQMLGSILPTGTSSPAVPTLPLLPAGVTAGPGSPYAFVAFHEDDVSNQVGLAQNRQWLLSYGVGLGLRYRLSNAVVADTFAEYKAASNTICTGPLGAAGCSHIGPGARVGVQFLY